MLVLSSMSTQNLTDYHQTMINRENQRSIIGILIGSAPILFIVLCWIFVSVFVNNFVRFYQSTHKQRRSSRKHDESRPMISTI